MILSRNCSHHKHFSLSVLINITLINNDYIFPKILILNIKITKLLLFLLPSFPKTVLLLHVASTEEFFLKTERSINKIHHHVGSLMQDVVINSREYRDNVGARCTYREFSPLECLNNWKSNNSTRGIT